MSAAGHWSFFKCAGLSLEKGNGCLSGKVSAIGCCLSDANADSDRDGYTNLEEYLNGTDPNQFIDYRDPKNNVDALTARLSGL